MAIALFPPKFEFLNLMYELYVIIFSEQPKRTVMANSQDNIVLGDILHHKVEDDDFIEAIDDNGDEDEITDHSSEKRGLRST